MRYGRWLAATLFVVAIFALDWRGPSVGIPPGESQQQGDYYSSGSDSETEPEAETGDDRLADYTEGLVWLTGVLSFCGIAGIIVSRLQWIALRAQEARLRESIDKAEIASAQQSRDMQDSIAVTRDMAAAAQKSADIAEKSLGRTERPWIFISQKKFDEALVISPQRQISIKCVNHGRSPALVRAIYAELYEGTIPVIPFEFSATSSVWILHIPLGEREPTEVFNYDILPEKFPADAFTPDEKYACLLFKSKREIYFIAKCEYIDTSGTEHFTEDGWTFDHENGTFTRLFPPMCHRMT